MFACGFLHFLCGLSTRFRVMSLRDFTIIFRQTTLGRTPLEERSARSIELYLTTHNTHNRLTSMPPPEFEPAIPASKRPQTHASDPPAIGIRHLKVHLKPNLCTGDIPIPWQRCEELTFSDFPPRRLEFKVIVVRVSLAVDNATLGHFFPNISFFFLPTIFLQLDGLYQRSN
jgi:hypothetical protein